VDVRVETLYSGFSLEEYAREETGEVLVRFHESRQLATDPWSVSLLRTKNEDCNTLSRTGFTETPHAPRTCPSSRC
jgi:hypothetical protein